MKSTTPVRSLAWQGDELVDVVGGRAWSADGVERRIAGDHGPGFDRCVISPSGRYSVVYAERGTEALLLEGTRPLRGLTRSPDHAEDYDYPVALGILADGREILVHCPEESGVLQIEDVASGQRITTGAREARDVFHSRLSVAGDGKHLLVAGWVWHPYGIVEVFDLESALTDAAVLDGHGVLPLQPGIDAEVESACWLDADRLAVATGDEVLADEDVPELGRRHIGVWSPSRRTWLHRNPVDFEVGTLLAGGGRLVSLHGHPRLIDVTTGEVVAEWPELRVSRREGAYGVTHIPTPVAALRPDGMLLAVAQEQGIAFVRLPQGGGSADLPP
ncbi:hypothetical protein [Streptomyces rishiriensis]|uniref:hypothetical protein n=1 Tax=Streptomyces rishiriensis TaxID=68264 RepID=UPI0027D85280|nr:hypothetical protein [Streptomyces rishiriensis]